MQNTRISQLGDPLQEGGRGWRVVQDRGLPAGLHLPGGALPWTPRKIPISSTTRDLCSLGVDQDDNTEVPGAKAGLLAGPTLEDY
jgi:hypothetical protein